ncbi:HTH-type transcriptional regulator SyrM 1 [Halomonas sp. THAF12]|uniref:LysR substrate-binding domain-containing protein n=1 Tax=Halomonas sp. THAF12 TaxID=2587849 RepID=UPI0012696C55|nr:LysR substrate-binding domain-containing protein [Halomonas sp. THAF12]QFT84301.1 HTH-type transcriptional regulator SyrM 1 [Halomonas sp. THAF12]
MKLNYDLNLLRTFHALYLEQNVTRAGERLHLSQPSVSAALGRLRELFNDPLFIRDRQRMRPTEKADHLFPVIEAALTDLDGLITSERDFSPATEQRHFEIAANDYFEVLILPALAGVLREQAPGITLQVRRLSQDMSEAGVMSGTTDLAFGRQVDPPDNLVVREVIREGIECLVGNGHPLLERLEGNGQMTRDDFERYAHVLVQPHARLKSGIFKQLEGQGLRREVALAVTYFMAVPALLERSSLIASLPTGLCQHFRRQFGVTPVAPPVAFDAFPFHLSWHRRYQKDPAHRWLREQIIACCRTLPDRGALT